MSSQFRWSAARFAALAVLALAAGAGCGRPTPVGAGIPTPPPSTGPAAESADAVGADPAPAPPTNPPLKTPTRTTPPPSEDCVSYDPGALTVRYVSPTYTISSGSTTVARVEGSSDDVANQALALARLYRKHCYLGRNNTREERFSYIFDYWKNPTGLTPNIPHAEDLCSDYHPDNLTVENMGGDQGWRVKDHDHVLHLFTNESDARAGKAILAQRQQICFIGDDQTDNDGQNLISYLN